MHKNNFLIWLPAIFLVAFGAPVAADLKCPAGIGAQAGDAPRMIQRSGEHTLVVCGFAEEEEGEGPPIYSEFNIYSYKDKFRSLLEVGAVGNYWIQTTPKALRLTELAMIGAEDQPVFELSVGCTEKSDCTVGPKKCVFRKPKVDNLMPWEHLKKEMANKRKPGEALLMAVADLAYSGHEPSRNFFAVRPALLKLDGSAGELYTLNQNLMKRLREAKCF